jgi:DNA processing protein
VALAAAHAWLHHSVPGQRFLLTIADPDYPTRLLELPGAPLVLFGEGRRALLDTKCLAIVGSRVASRQGREHAQGFARELCRAGTTIVSGMARGIDAAAHAGALDAGGATIAVLGTGPDIVYPRGHQELHARIVREGLVLSEFPPGTAPLPHHFPRRNRIIAGLCLGVLIVEAALRSGSLLTARLCADAGREVFALPGSIHAPLARGCHELIRQGASLVESPGEILQALGLAQPGTPSAARAGGPSAARPATASDRVLDALGHDPADFDTLALRSGLAAGALAALLLELEFAGRVEHLGGNRYQRMTATIARTGCPGYRGFDHV